MLNYLIRCLLQSVLVVFGVTVVVYFILYQTGDPTFLLISSDASAAEAARVRHQLGFDRPWYVQYKDFLVKALHGNFGVSLRQGQPVMTIVMQRLPATLELTAAAVVLALAIAVPVGIISATRRNSLYDNGAMLGAIFLQAVPGFFLGIMLLYIFGGILGWLPIGGRGSGGLWDQLQHLILPAITLGAFSAARTARLIRSNLLEVLGQDYVRTGRAKGLRERTVVVRHALKNALIPVVTVLGLDFGVLLSGAVITETVFAWPGVGSLVINAVEEKDFPLVLGCVTVISVMFVAINLGVDLIYGYLDPRIHYA